LKVDALLSRLDKVKRTGAENWIACCPAHDDRQPSMTVRETGDGKILIHCFAGCGVDSILAAVGMEMTDLFPDGPLFHHARPLQHRLPARDVLECVAMEAMIVAITAAAMADGKAIPLDDIDRCRIANLRIHEAIDAIG
jgi:hypothetical protein